MKYQKELLKCARDLCNKFKRDLLTEIKCKFEFKFKLKFKFKRDLSTKFKFKFKRDLSTGAEAEAVGKVECWAMSLLK